MLSDSQNYNLQPLDPHTDESNSRNRIGMRYARGLCGHAFEEFTRLEEMPPEGSDAQRNDWMHNLGNMQALSDLLCEACAGGGTWLHDFIANIDVELWDTALDEIIDDTSQQTMRLPKIDKTNPDLLIPALLSVVWWSVTTDSAARKTWWKGRIRDFSAAAAKFDRDPRVHIPTNVTHAPT